MIYELKLHVEETTVPVIRTIQVKNRINFQTLHIIIVSLFGLPERRTYTFHPKKSAGKKMQQTEEKMEPKQSELAITTWLMQIDDVIKYTYHASDADTNCHIRIELQSITDIEPFKTYPCCLFAQNDVPSTEQSVLSELNSEAMIQDINEKLFRLASEEDYDYLWNEVLVETKNLYENEPWRKITDDQVYVIYDEANDEHYFCSILGKAEEIFGLSVYIGFDGLLSLLDSFEGAKTPEEIMKHQRSLLISFEN